MANNTNTITTLSTTVTGVDFANFAQLPTVLQERISDPRMVLEIVGFGEIVGRIKNTLVLSLGGWWEMDKEAGVETFNVDSFGSRNDNGSRTFSKPGSLHTIIEEHDVNEF